MQAFADPKAILAQVARTSPTSAELTRMSGHDKAKSLMRCFDLAGTTYCLGFGFVGNSLPDAATYASIAKSYEAGEWDEPGAENAAGYLKKRLEMD